MKDKKLLGKTGEDLAVSMLFSEGYRILKRNFRSYFGEIDIICEKDDTVYFVEVKTRTCDVFGEPEEAVNAMKQKRIRKTASYYLSIRPEHNEAYVAFKVIEIMIRETDDCFMQTA